MKKIKQLVLTFVLSLLAVLSFAGAKQVNAADNSLQQIKDKGTIIMGTSPDYAPYEFLVNVGGKTKLKGWTSKLVSKLPRISA